ncbi:hypothetical protein M9H77_12345 [Catharanthus roseus]|uniref:Uncharacterized protein n=1 Tax=Catharanthus roseus TaxID=4058 RepID=A0ACC0BH93_CATRO|nr:hypothetical protein M9H77_12345 [Catharanthus roseus]
MVMTKNANVGHGEAGGSSRGGKKRKGKQINLVGVGYHIGPGKIYNQNTFKRMGFERTNEGLFIRGGLQGSDGNDKEDNGDEEEGNEPRIWMKMKQMKRIFEGK